MNLKLTKIYFSVQDYLMILFGTLLYGFGFNAFILSNEIVTGGVSGICALIFFASNGLIPVSVSYFVITLGFSLSLRVAAERTTYTARPAVYGYHNRSVHVWCRTRIGILGER